MKHFRPAKERNYYSLVINEKYNINHYATCFDKKASVVERLNGTLNNIKLQDFTSRGSYEWLDLLKIYEVVQ